MNLLHNIIVVFIAFVLMAGNLAAESPIASTDQSGQILSTQIKDLKEEVLNLNRDLFILEEELLFPVNTQINVFVSIDSGYLFSLDSVRLKIDNKVVSSYLYTEREIKALQRGGVQRLYIGNLASGEHELTAIFTGKGPSKRNYKRASTVAINKTDEAKFVELKIIDETAKEQPGFDIKIWE